MTYPTGRSEADTFLMGGGGAPSAFTKTDPIGTVRSGVITEEPTPVQQRDIKDNSPKFWADGNPMMQLPVTVQTELRNAEIEDDDGQRRFFIKGEMRKAAKEALKAAGADGLRKGGVLTVKYIGDGVASGPGMNPPKLFAAHYKPPAATFLADNNGGGSAGLVLDPAEANAVATLNGGGLPVAPAPLAPGPEAGSAGSLSAPPVTPAVDPKVLAALNALPPEQRQAALAAMAGAV